MDFVCRLINVVKKYGKTVALNNITLSIPNNSITCIIGPSGSGKTTLLNIISGIDIPSSGKVYVLGKRIDDKDDDWRARWRRKNVGVILQFFHLIPTLNAIENVILPMELAGLYSKRERIKKALELLEFVGLKDKAYRYPHELSGGEQQRVAIARALANNPPLIIADEPMAHLDTKNKKIIVDLLLKAKNKDRTVIIATHDEGITRYCSYTIKIIDGVVSEVITRDTTS